MIKNMVGGAALALVAFSGSALAADIEPMAYDWTGLYVGVNGGYAFGGNDDVAILGRNAGDMSLNGLFGGAQIGYNKQLNNIVLGLEADGQIADINDTDPGFAEDQIDWFATGRVRAGYAADRVLIFATGGVAVAGGTYKELVTPATDDFTRVGWTVGGGLEFAMTDSISVKGEYLYANFGRWTVGGTEATPDFHAVRLGVNFRF